MAADGTVTPGAELSRAGSTGPRPSAPDTALTMGGLTALTHAMHVVSLTLDELRASLGARLELNAIDVSALIEIYNHPDIRPTDLGRNLNLRSAGLTALADRLERAGFLRRSPDPSDRRGSQLRLSPAGSHAVGWIFDTVTAALAAGEFADPDAAATMLIRLADTVSQTRLPD